MAEDKKHRLILAIDSAEYEEWIPKTQQQLESLGVSIEILRPQDSQPTQSKIHQQVELYKQLAQRVNSDIGRNLGVIVTGTGTEASIILNKLKGIRAAFVSTHYLARMCRLHNNANIMIVAADHTTQKTYLEFLQPFMTTDLEVGPGKFHEFRVAKIMEIEGSKTVNTTATI